MKPHQFDKLKNIRNINHQKKDKIQNNIECRRYYIKNIFIRGIYRLYYNNEVVYVGQSKDNVIERISRHYKEQIKIFDSFTFTSCENLSDIDLDSLEKRIIKKYNPKYNIVHNKE